ncbi:MAG TPA: tellurite resistance/C4-dicarboxylate transporter family protein [Pseudogracilibacillus sp.]|nr:tellurite resistance/C4-dicarboxylate transporter family protein [Pseudogracilibacillus sp.]
MNYLLLKAKRLFPAYFAMVMTTGALSIGFHFQGFTSAAKVLLGVNVFIYGWLWVMTFVRLFKFYSRLASDVKSHDKGPGFFTLVAGTCVFGSQVYTITNNVVISSILWGIGIFLWILVMYTFFTSITIRKNKPSLGKGINGAWLIAAVGTQSVSILGTLISPAITNADMKEMVLFFTLCMYFLGCMLYLNIITLIFYRFSFLKLDFKALTPPYWINMGAVAITTLAGATLILHQNEFGLILEITPFLKGFTTFFWVTGTWWIPLLFILMIWKHVVHRFPLTYDPQYWGMAFPLAMYTTSTWQLAEALELSFLTIIPQIMVIIAAIVYIAVFLGFLHHIYRDMQFFIRHKKAAR